jgi:lysozyme
MIAYNLKIGDEGQEVKKLQEKLTGLTVDGSFGKKTEDAVKNFQKITRITVNGVADVTTLAYLGLEVLSGIDVSSHNGQIDWAAVAKGGSKFAWVKHTEGQTHNNPRHEENLLGARKAGLYAGAYHFGRSDTDQTPNLGDAVKEANWFLKQYKALPGDLVPALDVENGLKTDDNYNAEWIMKWLEVVGTALGCKPIIYTAKWATDMYINTSKKALLAEIAKYPLWVASYNSGINPNRMPQVCWDQWKIWQWTGSGTVPGVVGKCDQNWMSGGTLSSLRLR